MPHPDHELAARFLDVIEQDIVPLTRVGVARGDKVFGAAILRKSDLSLVVAGTNRETENPLLHGEVATLNAFYDLPGGRAAPGRGLPLPLHPRTLLAVPFRDHLGGASTTSTTSSAMRIPGTPSTSPMTSRSCARSSASRTAPMSAKTRSGEAGHRRIGGRRGRRNEGEARPLEGALRRALVHLSGVEGRERHSAWLTGAGTNLLPKSLYVRSIC